MSRDNLQWVRQDGKLFLEKKSGTGREKSSTSNKNISYTIGSSSGFYAEEADYSQVAYTQPLTVPTVNYGGAGSVGGNSTTGMTGTERGFTTGQYTDASGQKGEYTVRDEYPLHRPISFEKSAALAEESLRKQSKSFTSIDTVSINPDSALIVDKKGQATRVQLKVAPYEEDTPYELLNNPHARPLADKRITYGGTSFHVDKYPKKE